MKLLAIILALNLSSLFLVADTLPPEELRASWSELEDFKTWQITQFKGWGEPADGGSKVFFFQTASGDDFDVMAANPAYWNAEEKKERHQVFYLIHENHFYRVDSGSEQEKRLIRIIEEARTKLSGKGKTDPKLLENLAKHILDRKPMFKLRG